MKDEKITPICVYLAGAVDAVTRAEALDWRFEASRAMPPMVLCFNPVTAYLGVSTETARAVNFLNRHNLNNCEGVLCNLEHEGAFGTIREIEFASQQRKPVAVFGRDLSQHVMAEDLILADNMEHAIAALLTEIMQKRDQPVPWLSFPVLRLGDPGEETDDELEG